MAHPSVSQVIAGCKKIASQQIASFSPPTSPLYSYTLTSTTTRCSPPFLHKLLQYYICCRTHKKIASQQIASFPPPTATLTSTTTPTSTILYALQHTLEDHISADCLFFSAHHHPYIHNDTLLYCHNILCCSTDRNECISTSFSPPTTHTALDYPNTLFPPFSPPTTYHNILRTVVHIIKIASQQIASLPPFSPTTAPPFYVAVQI